LGPLKYSRKHESESDKMGLIFMALAGYDQSEAVSFWGHMAATGGAQISEFMSTHPSHETRISVLKTYLPEALSYYKK
tara:strand:- start:2 stop:235 length:234 start_codon:yes stop_codon:yes gene_type:complete